MNTENERKKTTTTTHTTLLKSHFESSTKTDGQIAFSLVCSIYSIKTHSERVFIVTHSNVYKNEKKKHSREKERNENKKQHEYTFELCAVGRHTHSFSHTIYEKFRNNHNQFSCVFKCFRLRVWSRSIHTSTQYTHRNTKPAKRTKQKSKVIYYTNIYCAIGYRHTIYWTRMIEQERIKCVFVCKRTGKPKQSTSQHSTIVIKYIKHISHSYM